MLHLLRPVPVAFAWCTAVVRAFLAHAVDVQFVTSCDGCKAGLVMQGIVKTG